MILKPSLPDSMISFPRIKLPIAVFLALVFGSAAGAGTLGKTISGRVVSITDGDTIRVIINNTGR